jgi:hypothetical protein
MPINLDQILSAARWMVTALGTYFATKGVISTDQVQLIGGAVAAVLSLGWSFYVHADAAADPNPAGNGTASK